MPKHHPLKQEKNSEKGKAPILKKEKLNSYKKVRIIYSDPYATDYSSDEEDRQLFRSVLQPDGTKRFFKEILVPNMPLKSNSSGQMMTETGPNLYLRGVHRRTSAATSMYKGVWRRESGRFAAEIRDPFKRVRVWLGTFDTELEAAVAFSKKKNEFSSRRLLALPEKTSFEEPAAPQSLCHNLKGPKNPAAEMVFDNYFDDCIVCDASCNMEAGEGSSNKQE